jgi:hypothetical protein
MTSKQDLASCKMYEHALSTSGSNPRQSEFGLSRVWLNIVSLIPELSFTGTSPLHNLLCRVALRRERKEFTT